MRAQVVQQYDFQTEVLPPVLVGLLLDIVGRFLGGELSRLNVPFADQIFLDMSGTLYAAVMVGPWWAALVGIAANAINGNFNDNYFPYGVVNVFGGLAWGYLALAMNLRGRLAEHRPSLRTFLNSYVALVLVGALVCGLASSLTHLVLLPSMKLPLARGGVYDDVRQWLSAVAGGPSDVSVLVIGDLVRDLLDKAIAVAIGLVAVWLTTTMPNAAKAANWRERSKTDVLSVLSFTVLYGAYLFVARIFQPQISFVIFGQRGEAISWLQSVPVIALLYLPIGVALIAFLLFTYDGESPYGSTVDAHRRARKSLLRQMLPSLSLLEADIMLRFTQGRRLFGLYLGIAAWPLEKFFGSPGVTRGSVAASNLLFDALFFGGAVAVAGYYFYQNDKLVRGYSAAHRRLAALEQWMSFERATTPRRVAGEIIDLIVARLHGTTGALLQSGPLAYKLVLPHQIQGAQAKKAPTAGIGVGLVALVSDGKIIDEAARQEFERLLDATAPDVALLLSLNPTETRQIEWLKSLRGRHSIVGLLSWYDVARMIEHTERGTGGNILTSARMRTLELISGGKPMDASANNVEVQALAARTLPALAYVIDHLPRGSTIYDLGCGRGRHTIYALRRGHRVIAVDRHDGALADLHRFLDHLGPLRVNAVVTSGDYSEVSRATYGSADLVVAAGIMQYVTSLDELQHRLDAMSALTTEPNAKVFVEMLFDMTYDGKPATDGRCNATRAQFEEAMRRAFPAKTWSIQLVNGPRSQVQDFSTGPRSFYPLGRIVESTCVEYLLVRLH